MQWICADSKSRACTLCRQRKVRCDRRTPCKNCLRVGNEACVYRATNQVQTESSNPPVPRQIDSTSSTGISTAPNYSSSLENLANVPAAHSHSSALEIELMRMKRKVQQLENQLARQAAGHSQASEISHNLNSSTETISCRLSGVFHVHTENSASSSSQGIARSIAYKTHLLGQSHWAVNSISLVSKCMLWAFSEVLTEIRSRTYS